MSKQLSNVRHDYIRYANCWEDADLLLEGLACQPGDKILSIGSAGDNSFSLLSTNPDLVVAVDINEVQLRLVELKKSAFLSLNHSQFLEFLGFKASSNRMQLFELVKANLTNELSVYWSQRAEEIELGLIYQGKFERYFKLFSKRILPLIHTKKRIAKLFENKTAEEQQIFYQKHWNNWRWRLLFKLFFSKFVMGRFGRDPAFLKEVEVPVSEFIFGQAEAHLSSTECQENYFLRFTLSGNFGDGLPHYARAENFETIQQNCHKLKVFEGLAEAAFEQFGQFNRMNLSNIFEYMNKPTFHEVAKSFAHNCLPKGRIAYWNLMVPRSIATEFPEQCTAVENAISNCARRDKGFFYKKLHIDQHL